MSYLDARHTRPADGLPDCDDCDNLRYVHYDVPPSHALFGKAVACPRCMVKVIAKRQAQLIDALSDSVPVRTRYLLSSYNPADNPEALATIEAWIDATLHPAEDKLPWLTLMGGFGTGKTHLLVGAYYRLRDAEVAALYSVTPKLLETLRAGFKDDTYIQRLEQVRAAPALIIDDLGTESRTQWTDERMFDLFDYRYRMRLPTAVATNLAPRFMEGRIASRLRDQAMAQVVAMRGQDWRTRGHGGK